ncbi:MAG: proline-rich domain-containing protein, partial [Solirubrobacteraceae bacterium]
MSPRPARSTKRARWRLIVLLALAVLLGLVGLLMVAARAGAEDIYSNIGPAPQVPLGGIFGRYPLASYQLDEFFPAISVGVFSGVNASGVAPMIAFFIAQVIWLITAFVANAVITLFSFCFSLNLLGSGSAGAGALAPIGAAIHNVYANTFGTPWLIAAFTLLGIWATWRAIVQRRYTETAAALAVSLLYCVLGLGIVIAPDSTIGPASNYANQMSSALLSLTAKGEITSEAQAKKASADQLFSFLVLEPWTVLEFGGIEHCVTETKGHDRSIAVRPLASSPTQETSLVQALEGGSEVHANGKTCINNLNKYASHFLQFPAGSKQREAEHEALEKGDTADLPEADAAKNNTSYRLGPADRPAAEAMNKEGQYQRLLLAIVILAGELGAFLLLGALALGVLLAALMLLLELMLAPAALVLGVLPGRGHEFFRTWLARLAGCLLRKVIYSLILALTLAVCHALAAAASNLGWLLAFALQATFLWMVFLQRNRLTNDFVAATAGARADRDGASRLQSLYYATRLVRGGLLRAGSIATPMRGRGPDTAAPSPPTDTQPDDGQAEPPTDDGHGPSSSGGEPPGAPLAPQAGGPQAPSPAAGNAGATAEPQTRKPPEQLTQPPQLGPAGPQPPAPTPAASATDRRT